MVKTESVDSNKSYIGVPIRMSINVGKMNSLARVYYMSYERVRDDEFRTY
jgi:hypothetical protein